MFYLQPTFPANAEEGDSWRFLGEESDLEGFEIATRSLLSTCSIFGVNQVPVFLGDATAKFTDPTAWRFDEPKASWGSPTESVVLAL